MNEFDTLGESFIIVDNGGLRNANRAFFDNRFHQEWKLQAPRPHHFLPHGEDSESRHRDSMVRENLFCEGFVMRERQAARVASRVGLL